MLPLVWPQDGDVIVAAGAEGIVKAGAIAEAGEVADDEQEPFETVKVYDWLAAKPVMLPVVPEPVAVAPPGLAAIVHEPEGKPENGTLPVFVPQLG